MEVEIETMGYEWDRSNRQRQRETASQTNRDRETQRDIQTVNETNREKGERDREKRTHRETQRERHTGRDTDYTERQRETHRETQRESERKRDTHRERERESETIFGLALRDRGVVRELQKTRVMWSRGKLHGGKSTLHGVQQNGGLLLVAGGCRIISMDLIRCKT